ncbi:unnamed protein product [Caenorhabditis bovis]|uniref:Uncharacterized protein n=1 Tax=Caenorhabditis bovis TaxID=2654633 RepID=A0A8S1F4E0_9PELO|nr:unnamed protein product [Caenorhabditis bovis]
MGNNAEKLAGFVQSISAKKELTDRKAFENLLRQRNECKEKLEVALNRLATCITETNDAIKFRIQKITPRMVSANSRLDMVNTHFQKFLMRVRENLDHLDSQQLETNREFDEIRRKTYLARKYAKKKSGMMRTCYNWCVSAANWVLVKLGFNVKLPLATKKKSRSARLEFNESEMLKIDLRKSLQ